MVGIKLQDTIEEARNLGPQRSRPPSRGDGDDSDSQA